jgi:hypothetical protein
MSAETNSVLSDEERRLASHQEARAAIDGDVNARGGRIISNPDLLFVRARCLSPGSSCHQ